MRSSRLVLSLLLALAGGTVTALGAAESRPKMTADFTPATLSAKKPKGRTSPAPISVDAISSEEDLDVDGDQCTYVYDEWEYDYSNKNKGENKADCSTPKSGKYIYEPADSEDYSYDSDYDSCDYNCEDGYDYTDYDQYWDEHYGYIYDSSDATDEDLADSDDEWSCDYDEYDFYYGTDYPSEGNEAVCLDEQDVSECETAAEEPACDFFDDNCACDYEDGYWDEEFGCDYESANDTDETFTDLDEEEWSYDYYEDEYDWEDDYYDHDSYTYGGGEWDVDYENSEFVWPEDPFGTHDEMSVEAESGVHDFDTTLYEGYSDAYPYEEFAYPEDDIEQSAVEYSLEDRYYGEYYYDEYGYDYYGFDHYYDDHAVADCSGDELLDAHPTDLLADSDRQLLEKLESLCQDLAKVRRAALNDYLEKAGWGAIDFASRFEAAAGIEVLGLVDELPAAAAFLASFRLVEEHQISMDEGVELLGASLNALSWNWIEAVDQLTADAAGGPEQTPVAAAAVDRRGALATAAVGNPVVGAMVSLATRAFGSVGSTVLSISRQLAGLRLAALPLEADDDRSASNVPAGSGPLQR